MRLGYSQFGQCTLKVDCLEKELRLSIPVFYVGAPQVHLFTSQSIQTALRLRTTANSTTGADKAGAGRSAAPKYHTVIFLPKNFTLKYWSFSVLMNDDDISMVCNSRLRLFALINVGIASSKMRTKSVYVLCTMLFFGATFYVKADDEPDIDDSVFSEVC
jgi:hypothetical protein